MNIDDFSVSGPGDLDEAGSAEERANILIVDDLPEKLLAFEAVLGGMEQNLVFVRSGRDALREVLRRDFAVVLLDVNMPDLDGLETAELIRSHRRSAATPIIFITAYADELQTARGYSLGAVDYILSPVIPEVLRSKVQVFVQLWQMRREVVRRADDRAARRLAESARAAAEANNRRSEFLSLASRLLGRSLDVEVAMRQLAELVLHAGAPHVTIALSEEHGHTRRVCRAQSGGNGNADAVSWDDANSLTRGEQHVLRQAMQLRNRASDDECLAVPLVSGQRVHGVLMTASPGIADCALLDELASRAAAALDNAWLYRSLQRQIEERAVIERELQETNRRKDDFLAMLSHELRNPLAAACMSLDVLQSLLRGQPRTGEPLAVLDRQLQHMRRLMDELLDVARISRNKIVLAREPVDLNQIVANSVESLQPMLRTRRQTVRTTLPAEPVWINGDPARLTQIVSNLLHNASKYSPPGQEVEVECGVDGEGALIRVRDQGIGIERGMLQQIFEMFEQGPHHIDRSQGGLGVGLTLALRLAQLHGGHIEALSDGPGAGSEFRVRLPGLWLAHRELQALAPAAAPAAATTSRRVLVVDDNRDAADGLAQLFRFAGHEVYLAADGQAALAQATRLHPDAMVIDIGLPLIDGLELARRFRRMPAFELTPLIALTGYGQHEDREAAKAAGFDLHFVKPADVDELLAAVERLCAGAPLAAPRAERQR